ncbi:MAG: PAS domain-containing protein [Dehalococcoidia bacterium]|nr:MAG: PAS domain-containing protein [Dehalococcoidia bacterium]
MKATVANAVETKFDVASIRPRVAELERDDLENMLAYQRLLAGKNITRTIVRQSKDAIFISTGDGRFVDVNQPLMELLGYNVEDMVGQYISNICVNPADGDKLQQEVEQKGYVVDYKIRLFKKDGTELSCTVTSTVRWYNDESIPGNQPLFKSWVRKA